MLNIIGQMNDKTEEKFCVMGSALQKGLINEVLLEDETRYTQFR